jgi:hypothetical protein
MQKVWTLRLRQTGLAAALFAAGVFAALGSMPAAAQSLFTRHEVSVQFATSDGKPIADSEVRVFAPGQPTRPALVGRTDSSGAFKFPADSDGLWSAEARSGSEIAQVKVRVGGGTKEAEPLSPLWLIGGLLLLLVLAVGYRVARARFRRRGQTGGG